MILIKEITNSLLSLEEKNILQIIEEVKEDIKNERKNELEREESDRKTRVPESSKFKIESLE